MHLVVDSLWRCIQRFESEVISPLESLHVRCPWRKVPRQLDMLAHLWLECSSYMPVDGHTVDDAASDSRNLVHRRHDSVCCSLHASISCRKWMCDPELGALDD